MWCSPAPSVLEGGQEAWKALKPAFHRYAVSGWTNPLGLWPIQVAPGLLHRRQSGRRLAQARRRQSRFSSHRLATLRMFFVDDHHYQMVFKRLISLLIEVSKKYLCTRLDI
jgi:hypothetical protein